MAQTKRITVVDDYPEILDMIAEALTDEGYEVQTVASHQQAYEKVKSWKPDLVVLDLMVGSAQMGWAVLEQIKDDPEISQVPVVLCSASTREVRDAVLSLNLKGVDYLEKPFELDALLHKLDHLLDASQPAPGPQNKEQG